MKQNQSTSSQDYAPGLSDAFLGQLSRFGQAVNELDNAKKAEIKRMFEIVWERIRESNIKDYEITDNLSNIESLVNELLNA